MFKYCIIGDYKGSFFDTEKMPFSTREIAFFGRSNVGKSSTINMLFGKKVSITSKTPGKTCAINFFSTQVGTSFVVDTPGYGYAKRQENLREKWQDVMYNYIISRKQLNHCYIIVDARIGVLPVDEEVINIFSSSQKSYSIIFNKMDKLNKGEQSSLIKDNKEGGFFISTAKQNNYKTSINALNLSIAKHLNFV